MRAVVAVTLVVAFLFALAGRTQAQSGGVASYPAGWNLVAGPDGAVFSGAAGSLYTLQFGDAAYRASSPTSPVHGGYGYWAYFPQTQLVRFTSTTRLPQALSLPAGQYVMIGNPAAEPVSVSPGVDLLLTYDPATVSYTRTTVLLPGQGAWAYSIDGTVITFSSLTPPALPPLPATTPSPTPTLATTPTLIARLSPPAAPQGLRARALDATRVQVEWQPALGATGYVLLDATDRHQIAALAQDAITFTLVDLIPNSQYCVVIYAYNAAGPSPLSDRACAQTPAS